MGKGLRKKEGDRKGRGWRGVDIKGYHIGCLLLSHTPPSSCSAEVP